MIEEVLKEAEASSGAKSLTGSCSDCFQRRRPIARPARQLLG